MASPARPRTTLSGTSTAPDRLEQVRRPYHLDQPPLHRHQVCGTSSAKTKSSPMSKTSPSATPLSCGGTTTVRGCGRTRSSSRRSSIGTTSTGSGAGRLPRPRARRAQAAPRPAPVRAARLRMVRRLRPADARPLVPCYRCRFPAEYALANRVQHPLNVYLREHLVIGEIDCPGHRLAAQQSVPPFP